MRGELLYRINFNYQDGDASNKLILALNTPSGNEPLLIVLTTSKQRFRETIPGCHSEDNYFFIQKGQSLFHEQTWILFKTLTGLDYKELLKWSLCERNFESKGYLEEEIDEGHNQLHKTFSRYAVRKFNFIEIIYLVIKEKMD